MKFGGLRQQINPKLCQQIIEGIFHYDVLSSSNIPVLICWFTDSAAEITGQICHEFVKHCLNLPPDEHQLVNVFKYDSTNDQLFLLIPCLGVIGIAIDSSKDLSMRSNRHDRKELKASFASYRAHAFFHFHISNSDRL